MKETIMLNALRLSMTTFLLGLGLTGSLDAAGPRALAIGIDTYSPPGAQLVGRGETNDPRLWSNLHGAVKDATRIHDLLVARFGFPKENVQLLVEGQATRKGILDAIETHLIQPAKAGDLIFFFFAGHGSRVRNSLSPEADRLDESIVPADGPIGARDIRDKELRDRFNAILDKGAQLVVVLDSCHSGSASRGPGGDPAPMVRKLAIDPRDVADGSQAPAPWKRGALVLSAAQDDQLAYEDYDELNQVGGLFTIALTRSLRSSAPNEPAQNLFRRIKARMAASGKIQEPVLEATDERKAESLFGAAGAALSGRAVSAVRSVSGKTIFLQEGLAAGLTVGSELVKSGATTPRLQITSVDSLSQSAAKVLSPEPGTIEVGDLYVVDRWAPPDVPSLRVWMPKPNKTASEITQFARSLAELSQQKGHTWVADPRQLEPSHVVYFDGGQWLLLPSAAQPIALGEDPLPAEVLRRIAGNDVRLFVNLPPPIELQREIALGEGTENNAVTWEVRAKADYHLTGRYGDEGLSYGWVRPWSFGASGSPLPVSTDWAAFPERAKEAARTLETLAVRLGRIRAWLELEGPQDDGQFRYHLALKRGDSETYIRQGTVLDQEIYHLALTTESPGGSWRYVYAFEIDRNGKSTLLFPRAAGVENRFPPEVDDDPKRTYVLAESAFRISPPFGTDTFLLITTSEQLPDPTVLSQEGVRTRGGTKGGTSLQNLLANVGARTRGVTSLTPAATWSIERLTIESRARAAAGPGQ